MLARGAYDFFSYGLKMGPCNRYKWSDMGPPINGRTYIGLSRVVAPVNGVVALPTADKGPSS